MRYQKINVPYPLFTGLNNNSFKAGKDLHLKFFFPEILAGLGFS